MTGDYETRSCPYCKEDVRLAAVKCKHCGSRLSPSMPSHGGTCPCCKEEIKPEAIKCRHCHSLLIPSARSGQCGCAGLVPRSVGAPHLDTGSARTRRLGPAGIAPKDCYSLCLEVWLECLRKGGSWELCEQIIETCNDRCDVLFPSPTPEPGDVFVGRV
jgi:hypothetical protein